MKSLNAWRNYGSKRAYWDKCFNDFLAILHVLKNCELWLPTAHRNCGENACYYNDESVRFLELVLVVNDVAKTKKIKIIIADDHALLRVGLKQVLTEAGDMEVIAEAQSANEAIKLACQSEADVLLLDITFPDRHGLEALKYIKRENRHIAVLMLSIHREDEYAVRALKSGAAGYLNKQVVATELLDAVRTVVEGKKYITPAVAEILANQIGLENKKALHDLLSDREYQTFIMIASGLSVGEVAEKLSLSVKTVSMYRSRLLEKMHMRNNAELMHYAFKNMLVTAAT